MQNRLYLYDPVTQDSCLIAESYGWGWVLAADGGALLAFISGTTDECAYGAPTVRQSRLQVVTEEQMAAFRVELEEAIVKRFRQDAWKRALETAGTVPLLAIEEKPWP